MAKVTGIKDVLNGLDKFERRQNTAAQVGGELTAVQMQSFAKTNRNWKDRTNYARNGLTGSSSSNAAGTKVAIAQTPFYGVFLELANAGQYAIIMRTIRAHERKFLENVHRLGKV